MVTQPGRLVLTQRAIADFARQTHAARELVVLHDGDAECHRALLEVASRFDAAIRILQHASGSTLGALRNAAVDVANGAFVCQWDDDDRYHPERLALQWQALHEQGADFCFLVDQLHWFPASGDMYWDDWNGEPYPLNLVQGTLLGRRDCMPRYPELARGEDTGLLLDLLRRGQRVARLRDVGWCYVYVYHGANCFDAEHHQAISRAKALRHAQLLQREVRLRLRLAEYYPGFGDVHLPHEDGFLSIAAAADD